MLEWMIRRDTLRLETLTKWIDLAEFQRVVKIRFADVELRRQRRKFHIGHNAAILRAVATGAIELLNRELQRAAERDSVRR